MIVFLVWLWITNLAILLDERTTPTDKKRSRTA